MVLFSEVARRVPVARTGCVVLWHFNKPPLLLLTHTHDLRGVVTAVRVERKEKEVKLNTMETRQPEESYLSAGDGRAAFCAFMRCGTRINPENRGATFLHEDPSASSRSYCNFPRRSFHGGCNWVCLTSIFLSDTRYNCGILSTTHPSMWHTDKLHRATRAAIQHFRAVIHVDEAKLCQVHLLSFFPRHPLFPYFSASSWDIKYVWIILYLQNRTLPAIIQTLGDYKSCY